VATYPTSVPSFSAVNDGDTISDEMFELAYDEIVAIGGGLVNGLEHPLRLAAATEYTIASGAITVAKGYIRIDTEASAAADDLDTITPGSNVGEGSILVCRAENVARVVTLKDGSGNLLLNGDYDLSAIDRTITLIYDGTNWREVSRSNPEITGTWTPVIGGSGGTSGQTYTAQIGRYIKVGKLVTAMFAVQFSNKGTITTNLQVQGLPFTTANISGLAPVSPLEWDGLASNFVNIVAVVVPNSTTANLRGYAAAAASSAALDTSTVDNDSLFRGCIVYQAD
jgi:hypothetical protein